VSARHIIVFDVETTGTDRRRDQVIELCVQFGLEAQPERRTWRIKPEVPINPGAQAVHGISMEDLADCPPFSAVAETFRAIIGEAQVLVGYNLAFDIEMVQAEFDRMGAPRLDLNGKKIIDPFRLWQQCEPRTLQDAHRRFVGDSFDEAHSASADVAATGRVLAGMVEAFGLPRDWNAVAEICEPTRPQWVGTSRHIQWSEGQAVIAFGRHSGAPLWQLAHGPEADYLRWMMNKDFPGHVVDICRAALDLEQEAFALWLERTYGVRAAASAASATPSPTPSPTLPRFAGEEVSEVSSHAVDGDVAASRGAA
jgi:DNA polymerase-3 subunit epsilon